MLPSFEPVLACKVRLSHRRCVWATHGIGFNAYLAIWRMLSCVQLKSMFPFARGDFGLGNLIGIEFAARRCPLDAYENLVTRFRFTKIDRLIRQNDRDLVLYVHHNSSAGQALLRDCEQCARARSPRPRHFTRQLLSR